MNAVAQFFDIFRAAHIRYSDCDRLIREGIPWGAVTEIKKELELTDGELAKILDVSERTLSRLRHSAKRLTASAGDRLYRVVHIYALACKVLEKPGAARQWLRHPQAGLNGRTPLDFLQTEAGAREVEDLLGRMEYGVLA